MSPLAGENHSFLLHFNFSLMTSPSLSEGPLCLMMFSFPGEEFYEASPYEPVTSRLSDIFRLASIFSGKRACAGASRLLSGPGAAG